MSNIMYVIAQLYFLEDLGFDELDSEVKMPLASRARVYADVNSHR